MYLASWMGFLGLMMYLTKFLGMMKLILLMGFITIIYVQFNNQRICTTLNLDYYFNIKIVVLSTC